MAPILLMRKGTGGGGSMKDSFGCMVLVVAGAAIPIIIIALITSNSPQQKEYQRLKVACESDKLARYIRLREGDLCVRIVEFNRE